MAKISKPRKKAVSAAVCRRLRKVRIAGETMLPMPHKVTTVKKITRPEWEEWTRRQVFHKKAYPDYDKEFNRPSGHTEGEVWQLLQNVNFPDFERPPSYVTIISPEAQALRERAVEQGLVMVFDTFLGAGLGRGQVTYQEVFDALCRGFSDHFVAKREIVDSVRDMLPETVSKCRRDLLLSGIKPYVLWKAVKDWSENPIFKVEQENTGSRMVTRVLLLDEGEATRKRYKKIIRSDPEYRPPRHFGIKVSFADQQLKEPSEGRGRACGERPYNVVRLGDKSKELLKKQSAVTLYFDISAFNDDYKEAEAAEERAKETLNNDFGMDARLFSSPRKSRTTTGATDRVQPRWSKRDERVYYRSIELGILQNKSHAATNEDRRNYEKLIKCRGHIQTLRQALSTSNKDQPVKDEAMKGDFKWLIDSRERILEWFDRIDGQFKLKPEVTPELAYLQMDRAMMSWRQDVRSLLEEYDTARRHQKVFGEVYEKVKDDAGLRKIHSGFRRSINRRYQPVHFWPTYVTSKDRSQRRDEDVEADAPSEKRLESYRSRWFKGCDPQSGKPCQLTGFDISSSQMQIIASFMGDTKLEKVCMTPPGQPSFKESMAKWAWEMHENRELELRAGTDKIKPYESGSDGRLQEVVKELLMRVSYGSNWLTVENDQRRHPKTYGPGWETGSAGKFVDAFNERFPGPSEFRDICTRAARMSYQKNKCQGFEFTDPFDGVKVRWNPVARDDGYIVTSGGDRLRISVPLSLSRRRAHEVRTLEDDRLQHKKGEFAEDYDVDKEELENMTPPCLVHSLDSYYSSLVMSQLVSKDVQCFVGIHDCWLVPKSQIDILRMAMECAAKEWYRGLEPVYEALLRHLKAGKVIEADTKGEKEGSEAYVKVAAAYEKWKERISEHWIPRFRAKPVLEPNGSNQ